MRRLQLKQRGKIVNYNPFTLSYRAKRKRGFSLFSLIGLYEMSSKNIFLNVNYILSRKAVVYNI